MLLQLSRKYVFELEQKILLCILPPQTKPVD